MNVPTSAQSAISSPTFFSGLGERACSLCPKRRSKEQA